MPDTATLAPEVAAQAVAVVAPPVSTKPPETTLGDTPKAPEGTPASVPPKAEEAKPEAKAPEKTADKAPEAKKDDAPAAHKTLLDDEEAAAPEVAAPFDLKIPEKSPLTKEQVAEIGKMAAEQKLTVEQAQKLVDRESKVITDLNAGVQAKAKADVDLLYAKWGEEAKADPLIGGPKWAETKALAKRALDIDPAFKSMLMSSPWANNKQVLGFLAKVGALTREGQGVVPGAPPNTETRTASERWYGPSAQK